MSNDSTHNDHIVPVWIYFAVFFALMALTATTVAVAYLDLGPLNLAAAITIAMIKTVLVLLYFMHVRYSNHLVKVFVAAGFLWLAIMLVITMSDYATRSWIATPRGW